MLPADDNEENRRHENSDRDQDRRGRFDEREDIELVRVVDEINNRIRDSVHQDEAEHTLDRDYFERGAELVFHHELLDAELDRIDCLTRDNQKARDNDTWRLTLEILILSFLYQEIRNHDD